MYKIRCKMGVMSPEHDNTYNFFKNPEKIGRVN